MKLELASTQSIRDFVANLKAFKSARPLTHLICNAAVYRPTDPEPAWTDDGFEMSMGVNHLGHFLLVNLLMDDMSRAKGARVCSVLDPRCSYLHGESHWRRRSCLFCEVQGEVGSAEAKKKYHNSRFENLRWWRWQARQVRVRSVQVESNGSGEPEGHAGLL